MINLFRKRIFCVFASISIPLIVYFGLIKKTNTENVIGQSNTGSALPQKLHLRDTTAFFNTIDSLLDVALLAKDSAVQRHSTAKLGISMIRSYLATAPTTALTKVNTFQRRLYYKVGVFYDILGLQDSAILSFKSALLFEYNHISSYIRLSNSFTNKGDYHKAISYATSGLRYTHEPDEVGDLSIELSAAHFKLGNRDSVIELVGKALLYNPSTPILAKLKFNRGNAYMDLNKNHDARQDYIYAKEHDEELLNKSYINMAHTYISGKQYNEAKSLLSDVLKRNATEEDKASAYHNLGWVFSLRNMPDSALALLQMALSTSILSFKQLDWKANPSHDQLKEACDKAFLMSVLRDKATALSQKNENELAIKTYGLADSVCDLIFDGNGQVESKLFWREQAYPLYYNAVKLCYKMGKTEEAYYFFEKSRAVLLLEHLSSGQADKQVDLVPLEHLRRRMKVDQALLMYLLPMNGVEENQTVQEQTYVLKVGKKDVSLKAIDVTLDSLSNFTSRLHLDPKLSIKDACLQWYSKLIQPMGISNSSKSLIISPIGLMNSLPFEALIAPDSKPLIHYHSIQYVYSASTWLAAETKRQASPPHVNIMTFAPTTFSYYEGRFESLLLDSFNETLEPNDKLFSHKLACKDTFCRWAGDAKVIHLFTHAQANGRESPTIFFHHDSLVLDTLYKLELKADLVILSVCEGNIGKYALGEGVLSLANGFAHVGVPATIATLWTVEDTPTHTIVLFFLENLKQGMPKSKALQLAKLKYIKEHPYAPTSHWAGLVLYGSDKPIPQEGSNWWYRALAGLGAIATGTYIWWRKNGSGEVRPKV